MLLNVQLPLLLATVVPMGVPLLYIVMVSPPGATPEMLIRLASVMPSLVLVPVSGLMPRMVGGAPIMPPFWLPCLRRPAPGVQRGAVGIRDDRRGLRGRGRVPLKLRPRA